METAWLMLFFFAGLFGSAMLILLGGIQGREQERAQHGALAGPAVGRSFFATIGDAFAPEPDVDSELVEEVASSLRRRTELAARFVEGPSIDTFHALEEIAAVRSALDRIESFLTHERVLAGQFVADPTLDRFQNGNGLRIVA